jgi:acetyl-CoA C-acetyltransferase
MAAKRKALARDIVVVGAGVSKFGTFPEKTSRDLLGEAYSEALTSVDKGVDPNEIEALYLGNYSSDLFENQGHIAPLMADWLGLLPKPAVRVEGACGSSGLAFREGIIGIASGLYDTVMVAGVEKMSNLPTEGVTDALATASDTIYEFNQAGYTFPGVFAIIASAYLNSYGATREHLMRVAIKNHQNGALNPKAQFTITLHEMMESRRQRLKERGLPDPKWRDELDFLNDPQSNPTVAWPLSLFDCAPITDGASCVILTAKETAHNFTDRPVHVAGTAHASGGALSSWSDLSSMPSAQVAARQAYEMAGVTPNQIDLAEVHDCFTIAEIVATEDLGFFPRGQGALAAAEGQTARDGVKPINTSGGLKAKGHPVGATGTAQITEIWKQLRGEGEGRQIPNKNVEFGLTHNVGGTGGTCVVHILRRD